MLYLFNLNSIFLVVSFLVTAVAFLLSASIVLFIIFYAKKKTLYRMGQQDMEFKFQKELLAATITSQEDERKRMAKDLHDDIGPLLSLANLYLDVIREQVQQKFDANSTHMFSETRKLLDMAIEQAKRISYDMTPYGMELLGLRRMLNNLVERVGKVKNLHTTVSFDNEDFRLQANQEVMAYRVITEALNNIVKHSSASFIHISQYINNGNYIVEISHDGNGLEQHSFEKLLKEHKGMGLKNMSSRLQASNGGIQFFRQEDVYFTSIVIPMVGHAVQL